MRRSVMLIWINASTTPVAIKAKPIWAPSDIKTSVVDILPYDVVYNLSSKI